MLDATAQFDHWPKTVAEFDRLIAATQDELIHFAFHRLGNAHDAEDVVQDVYVDAYRDRAKRTHISAVRPYLFRMVGNRCTDRLRSRRREGAEPVVEESLSTEGNAFHSQVQREQREQMNRLLDAIPTKEAEVVRLRVFSDLSFAEIASTVGSSVATVKSRFRYGLDRLRRKAFSKEVCHELRCGETTME